MQDTPLAVKSYRWRRHLARLFAVKLTGDIPERLIGMGLPVPLNAKRRRRLAAIRAGEVLFIHVPKNAGTSLSMALYGRTITHDTIRYYHSVAPDFVASAATVAVIRDPVERFVSAFRFAQSGGTHRQVSAPFRSTYAGFATIDDALDHLEQHRDPFAVDHIFRAQSWYLTDRDGRLGCSIWFRSTASGSCAACFPTTGARPSRSSIEVEPRPLPSLTRSARGSSGFTPTTSQCGTRRAFAQRPERLQGRRTPAVGRPLKRMRSVAARQCCGYVGRAGCGSCLMPHQFARTR